jgi:hypothetical protein
MNFKYSRITSIFRIIFFFKIVKRICKSLLSLNLGNLSDIFKNEWENFNKFLSRFIIIIKTSLSN